MRGQLYYQRLRRLATERGVREATGAPPAVEGRPDDFRLVPSTLIEDREVLAHPIGPPEVCPEPIAFVDGIQSYQVVGYEGTMPLVGAQVAAAVRLRTGGRFQTVGRAERHLLVGPPEALDRFGPCPAGVEPLALESGEPLHPLKTLEHAHRAIDAARAGLERRLGARFRKEHDAWLVVDGVLSDSDVWADYPKGIGISKSHATLPFEGENLTRYLSLEVGHRSSLFEPATARAFTAYSWGLRLWDHAGKDLLHGLVRIEMAREHCDSATADRVSRWLLAERVPLSRPDPRWDRLLYGVATVERHLRARS